MNITTKKTAPFKTKVLSILVHPVSLLLMGSLLIYGVFIPLLGFYWDGLDIIWFSKVYGPTGLAQYFSTNRPVWGVLYQINSLILGDKPWQWQVFMLFWRWICASGLYFLIRQLWQDRKEPAFIAAFVFLIFPGFKQQAIANVYAYFFIILSAFFFSLGLSLYALDHKKHRGLVITLAILLAGLNVFCMEYFFMLELLRPVLIWVKTSRNEPKLRGKLRSVVIQWLPFLMVFIVAGIWRAFIFKTQTRIYQFTNLSLLQSDPWQGIKVIALKVIQDVWWTVVGAWGQIFQFPSVSKFGQRSTLLYIGITFVVLLFLAFVLLRKKALIPHSNDKQLHMSGMFIVIGLIAVLLGGIPIWITGLHLGGGFPSDRFSLPFILGSSLIFTGVIFLFSRHSTLLRAIFIVLIALASGYQARIAVDYQRDWEGLQRFLGQLAWRIPSLEPNTLLMSNELPLKYYSDMSITGPINWTYDHILEKGVVPYLFYYPTVRLGTTLPTNLDANQKVDLDLLIGKFNGNLGQSITIYYNPPACLRIIDPEIESDNLMVPFYIRRISQFSNNDLIHAKLEAQPPDAIFSAGPSNKWCYYYEKADLARYQKDWQTVVDLGNAAFNFNDNPNDPAERLPFIEGYAHVGNWQRALDLSQAALDTTPAMNPVLCKLWRRIDLETASDSEKQAAFESVNNQLNCGTP